MEVPVALQPIETPTAKPRPIRLPLVEPSPSAVVPAAIQPSEKPLVNDTPPATRDTKKASGIKQGKIDSLDFSLEPPKRSKPQSPAVESSGMSFPVTDSNVSQTSPPSDVTPAMPLASEMVVPEPSLTINPIVQRNEHVDVSPRSAADKSHPTQAEWLRSTTSQSIFRAGRQSLDQAIKEYEVGAWASAESSAWDALAQIASAIDHMQSASQGLSAVDDLRVAKAAIIEARDFTSLSDFADSVAIQRLAMSHQTELLHNASSDATIIRDASDRYLNEARVRLGRLAAERVDAAEAMDLLAAIYLGRDDRAMIPGPTSLCLRRAALQGQPHNANLATRLGMQLADTGLHQEAYLVLTHAYDLNPTVETSNALEWVAQRCGKDAPRFSAKPATQSPAAAMDGKRPQVIQLSPSEFAAISKPVIQVGATQAVPTHSETQKNTADLSAERSQNVSVESVDDDQTSPAKLSPIKRLTGTLSRLWK
tara:strand:- start:15155 stop:16594 length:1440 start_codon:yes stop_codon:yes gene_type:complete